MSGSIAITHDQESDHLSSFGNRNVIAGFLTTLEAKISSDGEKEKSDISGCPMYFSWLVIASEFVSYCVRSVIFLEEADSNIFDASYKAVLEKFLSLNARSPSDDVVFFVKLRHLIVHKGFPNPHVVPSRNSRQVATNVGFDEDEVWGFRNSLLNPGNFDDVKNRFVNAIARLDEARSCS